MRKREALHDLIRSLGKNEKRFFKIYASRHAIQGKNNYVKLFEVLDSMKTYNEAKLLRKIRHKPFAKHFPSQKNHLYNLILECLNIYHKDSSIDRQIHKYINIARVLSDKHLDEQSMRIVEKAKKLSDQYNRFENILPLITLLKKTKFDRDTMTEDVMNRYYQEQFSSLDKLKNILEYSKTRDTLFLKRRHMGAVKNSQDQKFIKTLSKTSFLHNASKVNSFDANIYYLLGKIEYHRILRNHRQVILYSQKLFSLFQSNPKRIADCASLYIYGLSCFIESCHYMDRKQDIEIALRKLQDIPEQIGRKNVTHEIQVKVFAMYHVSCTDVYLHFREYKKGIHHVPAIEEGMKKYDTLFIPSSKMVLIFNVACLYFGDGQYKQALKWCNLVLNTPITSSREDVFCAAKILNLLIHVELRNNAILPSIIKSTYRFLFKKKRVYQFETLFLKYIKLFLTMNTKKDQSEILHKFRADLQLLLNDQFENVIFNDIDLIGWIDKKTGNRF